jgi:hypothetical protein
MTERILEIQHRDPQSQARTGILHLRGERIETPVFMPVGTPAPVGAISSVERPTLARARRANWCGRGRQPRRVNHSRKR